MRCNSCDAFLPLATFFSATLVTMAIFAFNLLGDACRDILDPQSRENIEHAV